MNRESRLPSTKSMCSSLGFSTRTRASTTQTAIPQTTMSNTQLMDLQRDRYQVRTSHSHLSLTICCGTLTFKKIRLGAHGVKKKKKSGVHKALKRKKKNFWQKVEMALFRLLIHSEKS